MQQGRTRRYKQVRPNCLCDASQWRRTWSRTTANGSSATRGFHSCTPSIPLGSSTRRPGAPLPLCSYVTRGLVVVDPTLGACLVMCSPRHLIPHLSHVYIRSTHSFRPQGVAFISFLWALGRFRLRAWGSKTTRESSITISSYTNTWASLVYFKQSIRGPDLLMNYCTISQCSDQINSRAYSFKPIPHEETS